jgi:GTP-binding protein EngB required for normal cell division
LAYGYEEPEEEKKRNWLDMIIEYIKGKDKEKKTKLEKVG